MTKVKSPFGPNGLVMTILSDDEVDELDGFSAGEEETVSTKKSSKKPTQQETRKEIRKEEAALEHKEFFAELVKDDEGEEVAGPAKTVLSFKSQTLREKIRIRAKQIAMKKKEAETVDVTEEQKNTAARLQRKAAGKAAVSDEEDAEENVEEFDDGNDEDDDADIVEGEEEEGEEVEIEEVASDDDEPNWAGDAIGDDDDEDLARQLNEDVFNTDQQETSTIQDFTDLKLSRPLIQGIKKMNFTKPTPIQAAAIPMVLGGADVLANAVTGSGKTAAFVIPMIERLLHQSRRMALTRAVIITPTRELAEQIHKVAVGLSAFSDVRAVCIVGGVPLQAQETELRSRPDIIVATPGRLIDHLANSRSFHLDDVEMLVLDEADRLLEMGFVDEVKEIVKSCPRGRQTLLFSATLSNNVNDLIHLSLRNPKKISVDRSSSIVDTLTQEFVRLRKDSDLVREAIVLALCKRTFRSRAIIFAKTKVAAHRLMILFGLSGLNAAELHGNLTQVQRFEALELFRNQEVDYLICTDIAARGIDIKGVQTVINLHMPRELAQYVHRVGRTARAGNKGISVSIVSESDRRVLRDIMKAARHVVRKRELPPSVIAKYSSRVAGLEGDFQAILVDEIEDRQISRAEMEANKAQNILTHQKEIYSRPARSWFQTEKEKDAIRESAARVSSEAEKKEADQEKAERQAAGESDDDMDTAKKQKKDPLRGLSRQQRRRKVFAMEAEKMARDTEKQIRESAEAADSETRGGGEGLKLMSEKERANAKRTVNMILHPEMAGKAVKRQTKRENRKDILGEVEDGAGPDALKAQLRDRLKQEKVDRKRAREQAEDGEEPSAKENKRAKSGVNYKDRKFADRSSSQFHGDESNAGRSRFAEATTKALSSQNRAQAAMAEARKPKKATGFKSKTRFKRR